MRSIVSAGPIPPRFIFTHWDPRKRHQNWFRCDIIVGFWLRVVRHLGPHTYNVRTFGFDRRGDYQNCSVLYCVLKLLCTIISTLRWAVLTVLWIGFCHTGLISLCVDIFVFICAYFVCLFYTATCMCVCVCLELPSRACTNLAHWLIAELYFMIILYCCYPFFLYGVDVVKAVLLLPEGIEPP